MGMGASGISGFRLAPSSQSDGSKPKRLQPSVPVDSLEVNVTGDEVTAVLVLSSTGMIRILPEGCAYSPTNATGERDRSTFVPSLDSSFIQGGPALIEIDLVARKHQAA